MLKLKFLLLLSFIISLFLFISCTDNSVNPSKALQIERQTGKELCQTCWLVIFDHLQSGQPVPYANVTVKYLPDNEIYFSGQSDEDGLIGFYWEDMNLPGGSWRVDAQTELFQGYHIFSWDGNSYKEEDVIMIGYE